MIFKNLIMFLIGIFVFPQNLLANEKINALSSTLISLRFEVEDLNHKLLETRDKKRSKINGLEKRLELLKYQLQKEEIKNRVLKLKKIKTQKELELSSEKNLLLKAEALKTIKELKKQLKVSLPFQINQRIKLINKIEKGLKENLIRSSVAYGQIWQFLQDEESLASEVSLNRQVVKVSGQKILCEVIHLGLSALYFKTPSGKFGWSVWKKDHGYAFYYLKSKKKVEALKDLFANLKLKKRAGLLQIPLAPSLLKELNDEI